MHLLLHFLFLLCVEKEERESDQCTVAHTHTHTGGEETSNCLVQYGSTQWFPQTANDKCVSVDMFACSKVPVLLLLLRLRWMMWQRLYVQLLRKVKKPRAREKSENCIYLEIPRTCYLLLISAGYFISFLLLFFSFSSLLFLSRALFAPLLLLSPIDYLVSCLMANRPVNA